MNRVTNYLLAGPWLDIAAAFAIAAIIHNNARGWTPGLPVATLITVLAGALLGGWFIAIASMHRHRPPQRYVSPTLQSAAYTAAVAAILATNLPDITWRLVMPALFVILCGTMRCLHILTVITRAPATPEEHTPGTRYTRRPRHTGTPS